RLIRAKYRMASREKQMLLTIIARFAGKSANFFVFAILARELSTADLGVYGFIFTASILFSTFFDVGVRNSVANFIGKEGNKAKDYAYQSLALFPLFGAAAAISVLIFYDTQ